MTQAERYVAEWAGKVLQATTARNRAVRERNHWMARMSDEGASLSEIASAAGMSKAGVAKLLGRAKVGR